MKNLYLVETTTDENWEINSGYHLIFAESPLDANLMTVNEVSQRVTKVINITELMKDKKFYTIINAQVE